MSFYGLNNRAISKVKNANQVWNWKNEFIILKLISSVFFAVVKPRLSLLWHFHIFLLDSSISTVVLDGKWIKLLSKHMGNTIALLNSAGRMFQRLVHRLHRNEMSSKKPSNKFPSWDAVLKPVSKKIKTSVVAGRSADVSYLI